MNTAASTGAASPAPRGQPGNERTRGASTVTMQLAGLLSDSPRRSGQRSLPQKASQAVNALLLETRLAQGKAARGIPEPRAVPRRNDRPCRAVAGAVRQGAVGLDAREAAIAAALGRAQRNLRESRRTCMPDPARHACRTGLRVARRLRAARHRASGRRRARRRRRPRPRTSRDASRPRCGQRPRAGTHDPRCAAAARATRWCAR